MNISASAEWFGTVGHLVADMPSQFHLHTHINGFCISTTGDPLRASKYETRVCRLDADDVPNETAPVVIRPYTRSHMAAAGHRLLVRQAGARIADWCVPGDD